MSCISFRHQFYGGNGSSSSYSTNEDCRLATVCACAALRSFSGGHPSGVVAVEHVLLKSPSGAPLRMTGRNRKSYSVPGPRLRLRHEVPVTRLVLAAQRGTVPGVIKP